MGFIDDVKEVGKSVVEVTRIVGHVTTTITSIRDTVTAKGGIFGLGVISTTRTFVKEKPTPKVIEKAREIRKKAPSVNKTRKTVQRARDIDDEDLALQIWLEGQKAKGKDTMATKLAERRLGLG